MRILKLALGLTSVAVALVTMNAQAGIDACGDIHVEAEAECVVEVEGGCEVLCEPVAFNAACAAELRVDCNGECNAEFEAQCATTCQGSCEAECEVDPGSFSCEGECSANCEGDCSAACQAADNQAECESSCKGSCSADCSADCEAVAPEADCEVKCQASCEGECTARANMDCQIDCQAMGFAACKAELQGGCEGACTAPEGALFCDGQYVDHGGNLAECSAALRAALDIEVDSSAVGEASSSCDGGSCEAEAEGEAEASASSNCSMAPVGLMSPAGGSGLLSLGLLGSWIARRRRR